MSGGPGRGRPRAFDWDEAARLRTEGVPVREIAERMGVSAESIYRATTPGMAERKNLRTRQYLYQAVCPDCGGPRNRYHTTCSRCAHARLSKVRDGEAYCPTCDQWKPLTDFAPCPGNPVRGVRSECRACGSERRTAYRAAHREADRAYQRERRARRREQPA